jgi:hypothetical protein
MQAKIVTARFYADHLLSKAPGMRDSIVEGADSVTALALESSDPAIEKERSMSKLPKAPP